ncbi:ZZ type zinc finger domain-containing protein [Balamuthia mandrillaris]
MLCLKVRLEEEVRRFSVPQDIGFSELRKAVANMFSVAPEQSLVLRYLDDEREVCTLGSDLELEEAKRLLPVLGLPLRLEVSLRSAASSQVSAPQQEEEEEGQEQPQENEERLKAQEIPEPNKALDSSFVKDVTIEDGAQVSVGSKFKKIWRIRNSGSQAWPADCVLKVVHPETMDLLGGGSGQVRLANAVPPGQEMDIAVQLVAASKPGRYCCHWRLFHGDEAFGARIWCDVNVVPLQGSPAGLEVSQPKQQKEQPKEQPKKEEKEVAQQPQTEDTKPSDPKQPEQAQAVTAPPAKWAKQLQVLAEMGFHQSDTVVPLLDNYDGDVQRTLEHLLGL